ncbi:alpha/beta fold hydrolase [Fertoebacter nigrum]|uniref:Alpha/beta fold hydrolase n=1 Tax=Fertoeibacter niger TaxID=2656921 RepID=A0A8X8GZI6_9RHOB|nr:alpha/beta fold hydrolase [Fertoeibacter niger]NUB44125.1 alpha/beta fold hydrolase [Fertoeibacter niger]
MPNDLDVWLAETEQQIPNIRPDTAKRIVWAGVAGEKTPLAVVYLHGFSASSAEIRPVPERVAAALGANLFLTRLAGHGRDGVAMAEPVAGDWINDLDEAMAIARRLGDRVILIGTSTGGTLAALAATDARFNDGLAGVVLISPNFGLRPLAARILDLPLARYWGPLVAGAERSFTPLNAEHARFWTTAYPTSALFPLAALMRHARGLEYSRAAAPALVIYNGADQVIDPARIAPVIDQWGGPVTVEQVSLGPGDDRYGHVIAGDILSPGLTEPVVARITGWARGL